MKFGSGLESGSLVPSSDFGVYLYSQMLQVLYSIPLLDPSLPDG